MGVLPAGRSVVLSDFAAYYAVNPERSPQCPPLTRPGRNHAWDVTQVVMVCVDEDIDHVELTGAPTLLAMPFGDRPAIVDSWPP